MTTTKQKEKRVKKEATATKISGEFVVLRAYAQCVNVISAAELIHYALPLFAEESAMLL